MTFTYLDHNASTPLDPEVSLAMAKWTELFGNPHAGHFLGGIAREAINKARENVLSVFGLNSDEWKCIFTSGASESNNMVIKGLVFRMMRDKSHTDRPIQIMASQVEHASVDKCLFYVRDLFGADRVNFDFLSVDSHGIVDLEKISASCPPNVDLVTCIHTVAETGAVQPVSTIASLMKTINPNALAHCDASQSVGKLDFEILKDMAKSVDFITVAGHKFGAPKGIGALIVRASCVDKIDPLIHGAGQEFGLRGGTENVASIVGLGRACELALGNMTSWKGDFDPSEILWNAINQELKKDPKIRVRLNSTAPVRSRFTLSFSVAGMNGPQIVSQLGNDNMYGTKICFSAGSACHSRGCPTPSKVLAAMGLDNEFSTSGVRLSISRSISREDLERAGTLVGSHIRSSL